MYRFLFEVVSSEKGVLSPFTGHLVRAAFLSMLRKHDDALAKRLHEGIHMRPYSTTPLRSVKGQRFERDNRTGVIFIQKGQMAKFNIGSLTIRLGGELVNILLHEFPNTEFKLGQIPFRVARINVEQIDPVTCLEHPKNIRKFRLGFRTPTFFNISGSSIVCRFPEPIRIFGNLASLWNTFVAKDLDGVMIDEIKFIDWVNRSVAVTAYGIRTKTVNIRKNIPPTIGFIGDVNFTVIGESKISTWLHPLLMLGTFSNIGQGRIAGFGVTYYSYKEVV